MKFEVMFTTGDDKKPLLTKMGKAGIDFLDSFREDFPQYKDIHYSRICFRDHCPISGYVYTIPVEYDMAKESGYFQGKTSITVVVGDHFSKHMILNVSEDIRSRRLPWPHFDSILPRREEEYLYSLDVSYVYDEAELLKEWREAGYPLVWK